MGHCCLITNLHFLCSLGDKLAIIFKIRVSEFCYSDNSGFIKDCWKLLHQLTGVRAADHPTAPVEALRDEVVYGKEAVQAFADHLAQVYEGGHQVPEDLIANIPSMH